MIKTKKVDTYKHCVIAYSSENDTYYIYRKDEWRMGTGLRYAEWEGESLEECYEWIDDDYQDDDHEYDE